MPISFFGGGWWIQDPACAKVNLYRLNYPCASKYNRFALVGGPHREVQTQKNQRHLPLVFFGGGWWIRTTEVSDNRFTVCPLWPLGKSPIWSW